MHSRSTPSPLRMRGYVVLALAASLLGLTLTGPSRASTHEDARVTTAGASAARPNIVFVLTDDLSGDLLRYMPAVRALAQRGMTFTNAIVSDSLCCPSRSSIFTGQYPHNTGVFNNDAPDGGFAGFLRHSDQRRSFSLNLAAAGYRTAFMGKYLNGYEANSQVAGTRRNYVPPGWTEWDGIGGGYRGFQFTLNHNHRLVRYTRTSDAQYVTNVLSQRAQSFISGSVRARRPFMIEVATFAPHFPYAPALADRRRFPGTRAPRTPAFNREMTNPPGWLGYRHPLTQRQIHQLDAIQRLRAQSVQAVDRMITRLQRQLVRAGQLRNTVFVFFSDNGYHMGQHRATAGKLTAWDSDIRVPLVIAGPGIAAGSRNNAPVQNVDLAPTFDQLAGATVPAWVDGRSFVPLLHGRTPATWRNAAYVEHRKPPYNPNSPDFQTQKQGLPPHYDALRGRNYTFVRYVGGFEEFYDHVHDPWELHNIAAKLPSDYLMQLRAAVAAYQRCHGSGCQQAGRMAPAGLPVLSPARPAASPSP